MSDTIAKDFRAWLSTQPIIAETCGGRVFEDSVYDEDRTPYIVFQQSSATAETDMSGEELLTQVTFDVEVRAKTQAQADVIANELRRLVNGFPKSDATDKTWNGRHICYAAMNDHSKDYEILPVGSFETDSIHALIVEVYADG